jgi:hypothetical protein
MACKGIDWSRSIDQQIDGIVAAMIHARELLLQIGRKNDAHPELITSENYSCFQSVIYFMKELAAEVESNPLYEQALRRLISKQRKKQQRIIARHFGAGPQFRIGAHSDP